jgi:hypothetical protein
VTGSVLRWLYAKIVVEPNERHRRLLEESWDEPTPRLADSNHAKRPSAPVCERCGGTGLVYEPWLAEWVPCKLCSAVNQPKRRSRVVSEPHEARVPGNEGARTSPTDLGGSLTALADVNQPKRRSA